MQYRQETNEPFWKYFERFKDLLAQCPHHRIEKWRQCQILYDGFDYQTKMLFENYVSSRIFEERWGPGLGPIWSFSRKTIQWEPCPEKTNPTTFRTGMHSIESSIAAEAEITQLMRRLELLEVREPNSMNQVNPMHVTTLGCTYCHALTHLFECPICRAQQMFPENMNAVYARPNYNPYSKTYNTGWRNHLNFSWS